MTFRFSPRRVGVALFDVAVVLGAFLGAFLLRFDFSLDSVVLATMFQTAPYILVCYFASFLAFSLYRGIYYFSSFSDLINITRAVSMGAVTGAVCILFMRQGKYPRSILLLHPMLTYLGIGGVRFGIRFVKHHLNLPRLYGGEYRHALLIGAGELGESLMRQILKTQEPRYKVVGFIDDDPAKWGLRVHGRTVFGGRQAIAGVLDRYQVDEIIIAISAKRGELVRSVVEALRDRADRPELKIAPSLEEMLKSPGREFSMRQVKPADLLNREVVKLDLPLIDRAVRGKTILVSGGGGTIGSELCRQVLQYGPAKLVLVDVHATSLFYAEAELLKESRGTKIVPVLGDIRDQALVERVFQEHKPHLVLHAAAHKHVHQLEFNVHEGVANNVLGTYYLASAALQHQAEVFLLVSTDKAVQPSSVMGATKRVAEHIVRAFAARGQTRFMAVRFGNVLGSSGSVLEIFQRQIARGGPVTVTHHEATRYFMTVEEAVQLILQAVAMAKGGEIFILKMGTPVRILDMARNLILLTGLEPDKDVEIQFTGLKQGEKIHEELIEDSSQCDQSEHPDILILRQGHSHSHAKDLENRILEFEILNRTGKPAALLKKLRELVPTFTPASAHEASGDAQPQEVLS
ncbi:MAG: polysaccharide biosynthesis protein [Elusimicrobia bacterium]|nr:polysaccharide biosynthesis protein [Elusimicrobiota bacterium]